MYYISLLRGSLEYAFNFLGTTGLRKCGMPQGLSWFMVLTLVRQGVSAGESQNYNLGENALTAKDGSYYASIVV